MRIIIIIFIIMFSGRADGQEVNGTQAVSAVDQLIQADSSVFIVDVRTIFEFKSGHLANAVHSNFLGFNFLSAFENVPLDTTIIIYCHSGHRSKYALRKLKKRGFKNVIEMEGGIKKWKTEGFEVVQDE